MDDGVEAFQSRKILLAKSVLDAPSNLVLLFRFTATGEQRLVALIGE
jgi:hypothetical protein